MNRPLVALGVLGVVLAVVGWCLDVAPAYPHLTEISAGLLAVALGLRGDSR